MSENSEVNLPEKATIEKTRKSDVSNLGIYNLPDKVAGIGKKVQNSPNIRSNRALEKMLRTLRRKSLVTLWHLEKHKPDYESKFGQPGVDKAEQELKDSLKEIGKIGSQRAEELTNKRIEKLSKMRYGM